MSTGRRPKRSPSNPNTSAPSGRIARVSVMATETDLISEWNSAATARSTNTIRKKSKASSIHPR